MYVLRTQSIRWARALHRSRVSCGRRSLCRVHVGARVNCLLTCRLSPHNSSRSRNRRRQRPSHSALWASRPEPSALSGRFSLHSRAAPPNRFSPLASTTRRIRMPLKALMGTSTSIQYIIIHRHFNFCKRFYLLKTEILFGCVQ